MYKQALQQLIEVAAREFFKEKTEYKEVCCYKVELTHDKTSVNFTANIVACDNDPKCGEYFTVKGYICYDIKFITVKDMNGKELYNRWA